MQQASGRHRWIQPAPRHDHGEYDAGLCGNLVLNKTCFSLSYKLTIYESGWFKSTQGN